jgi:phosphoribosyl 1,2-cyclic phosphate phosphodiesterase
MNELIILGCGSSGGVPLATGYWGQCNPNNPKNTRTRSSVIVKYEGLSILVDTSTDLRHQLLRENIHSIDAILYTHTHADHVHGVDELRQLYFQNREKLHVYAKGSVLEKIHQSFSYLFQEVDSFYPTFLQGHAIENSHFHINDVPLIMFEQNHGHQKSYGFRFGNVAYSTDVKSFPKESEEFLEGLDIWIIDCLGYFPHATHAHFDVVMEWIEKFKPKQTYFTHMCEQLDYDELKSRCPTHVVPAYDGLRLFF